jgi:D-alanyl-D-alanine carboxypeptidase/D-alanyl-D-alanine-endopeptidase (penicillin-binding protein 4)
VSGINYNGNCIDITVFPSGGRAAYSITPDTGYVDITNKASVTSEKKNTVWVSRLPESNKMTLYGKCYTKTVPFQVTVHRPAVFFGYILAEKLIKNSIGFSGNIIEKMQKLDTSAREVIVFERPFRDVLTRCNQDSFNLAAEALAKKVSAAKTTGGIGGQWKHAGQVIEQLMKQAGIETKGFVFDDGCGLSRKNRVTAEMISRLLYDVFDSPQKQIFIDSLAIGGVEGSSPVSRYFREPAYKGKIFAKSGTISGVKALSGYCCTEDGTYIFSIITNNANWQTRASINEIVMSIFEF